MKACRLSQFWAPIGDQEKTSVEQFLRLASISLSNTLSLDTLPLKYWKGRWVLQTPGGGAIGGISMNYIIIGFIIIIQLLLAESYFNQRSSASSIGPSLLPTSWSNAINAYRERAALMGSPLAQRVDRLTHTHTGSSILSLLTSHHESTSHLPDPAKKAIVLSVVEGETDLSTEVHESSEEVLRKDASAKRWEELDKEQKALWREKLKKAGAWSRDYGETIFKGVFFSELAGAVGRAAADALQG